MTPEQKFDKLNALKGIAKLLDRAVEIYEIDLEGCDLGPKSLLTDAKTKFDRLVGKVEAYVGTDKECHLAKVDFNLASEAAEKEGWHIREFRWFPDRKNEAGGYTHKALMWTVDPPVTQFWAVGYWDGERLSYGEHDSYDSAYEFFSR